jgi:predicted nuclease of predicted toxin-antitoxin system
LSAVSDQELIVYADEREAIAVTNNKDFIPVARRLRLARVVYLRVKEAAAVEAMARALNWLDGNVLPDGMVLRVPLKAQVTVMTPLPW